MTDLLRQNMKPDANFVSIFLVREKLLMIGNYPLVQEQRGSEHNSLDFHRGLIG